MRGLIRLLLLRFALPKLLAFLPAAWALLRGLGGGPGRRPGDRNAEPGVCSTEHSPDRTFDRTSDGADGPIERSFAQGRSDVVLTQSGRVIKELPDDNVGDRHQRILVELDSGLTVLIAHNIDLARRVDSPRRGDPIRFKGEYEFNEQGGVLHWTHHDPKGWHEDGWIEHGGEVYG